MMYEQKSGCPLKDTIAVPGVPQCIRLKVLELFKLKYTYLLTYKILFNPILSWVPFNPRCPLYLFFLNGPKSENLLGPN